MTKKSYDDWRLESMDKIDKLISVIREEGAIVNNVGDGKIFVLPVEEAYRIRTGEKGGQSLN